MDTVINTGLTFTEGPLAESVRGRSKSLMMDDLSPPKNASPSRNYRKMTMMTIDDTGEYTCRICLQACTKVQYCKCTGGMLCHQRCLKEYFEMANKRQGQFKCEICKQPYNVTWTNKCECSYQNLQQKIRGKPVRCGLYAAFFVCVVAIYIYLLTLLVYKKVRSDLVTVVIAIEACLTIIFLFFVTIWFCEYTVVRKVAIDDLKPMKKKRKVSKCKVHPFESSMQSIA